MIRIGQGFDVHAFAYNRPLIIGGILIPYKKGLEGHSDADVLLHAVTDAILGALALGDIGNHFPDTEPKFKNIDSSILLKKILEIAKNKKYEIENLDCTIIAQSPKMKPYTSLMKENISKILECQITQINIKATTTEKLGFIGREEGIAAQAIILLKKST